MKLIKSLAAVAAVIALTSCSPAQAERVVQSTPVAVPVAQVQEVSVPAEAAVTFDTVEAVTVEAAVTPVAVAAPVIAPVEFVEVATPVAPVYVAPATTPAPPVEYLPEPPCFQDDPCWIEEPPVEYLPEPPCFQDDPCWIEEPPIVELPADFCYQDMPCWDCEAMGKFCVDPKDVDAGRTEK